VFPLAALGVEFAIGIVVLRAAWLLLPFFGPRRSCDLPSIGMVLCFCLLEKQLVYVEVLTMPSMLRARRSGQLGLGLGNDPPSLVWRPWN
jgi:hypothetical protein